MNYLAVLNNQLRSMAAGFVAALPSIVIALVVLGVTFYAARFAARLAGQAVRHVHMRDTLKELVETLARLGVWIAGLLIAASIVVPGFTPAGAIAGLGIGALAVGFAFQDIFQNFLAGVLIMLRNKMRLGDVIECEGVQGRVEHITLRESHVRQLSGELTILPNSMLFKCPVQILTDEDERRNELVVGVSYDTDLDQAMNTIKDAIAHLASANVDKGIYVYAQEFAPSSIDLVVQWWSSSAPRDLREAKSEAILAIKRSFDVAGIEIPYPYVVNTFKDALPMRDSHTQQKEPEVAQGR